MLCSPTSLSTYSQVHWCADAWNLHKTHLGSLKWRVLTLEVGDFTIQNRGHVGYVGSRCKAPWDLEYDHAPCSCSSISIDSEVLKPWWRSVKTRLANIERQGVTAQAAGCASRLRLLGRPGAKCPSFNDEKDWVVVSNMFLIYFNIFQPVAQRDDGANRLRLMGWSHQIRLAKSLPIPGRWVSQFRDVPPSWNPKSNVMTCWISDGTNPDPQSLSLV